MVGIYPLLLLLIKWDVSQVLFIYIYFDDGHFDWLIMKKKQGVCYIMALLFTKKYLKAEEKLWKLRDYNSITNLKFQTEDKILSFKNPHIKIDHYYLGAKIH